MKVIAILSEPGGGKTTLMSKIVNHYDLVPHYKEVKLVPYLRQDNIVVLGKYEEGEIYGGTDTLSMAVQPEAVKFLDTLSENDIVLFEGDRLCNTSFLENCVNKYDTTIVYLKTSKENREKRYKERGSQQNETWLKGRETKISNILTNFNLMFHVVTLHNDDHFEMENNFTQIVELVDGVIEELV